MESFDAKQVTDLGTIMIGIFDQIVKAQDLWQKGQPEDQDKAAQCVNKIYEGFKFCIAQPAEQFRAETMGLYLEILIGMQAIGPDLIAEIDQC